MQTVDIIILFVFGFFFLLGLVRGLVLQIGSLVSFFASLWIAKIYSGQLAAMLRPSFSQWPPLQETLSVVFGFIIVFFVSHLILGLLVKLADLFIRRLTSVPLLNMANRLGGAAIGLVEGIFFVGIAITLLVTFPLNPNWNKSIQKSFFIPITKAVTAMINPLLPDFSHYLPKSFNPADLKLDQKEIDKYQQQFLKEYQKAQNK